ncbi:MAG TPA: thioredoxin domain-containing protein [Bacillota bacterium]
MAAQRAPNRLAQETSPYLLQHARNPVDWFPWSDEAFARAREQDRPIFLSIGYAACHWCHVMAHESFEDDTTAAYLNEHFVSIKVDREERPDLDLIYQGVARVMGEHGGWPLSVFLLPDGRPFWVGTYFPPEDRYGRPGFRRVLKAVVDAFRDRRAELEGVAGRVVEALAALEVPRPAGGPQESPEESTAESTAESPAEPPGPRPAARPADLLFPHGAPRAAESLDGLLERAADRLAGFLDTRHGGFGRQPKFPSTTALALLWRSGLLDGQPGDRQDRQDRQGPQDRQDPQDAAHLRRDHVERVLFTLRQMAAGGVYDQLGGGFHRYAVDAAWRIPHFEKMLYDNALLPPLYLDAYRLTGDESFAQVAAETLDYVVREMQDPDGGFYATQDADSEGEEGRFYVWRLDELRTVLGPADAELAALRFGVSPEGNFEGGTTVLHLARSIEDIAAKKGVPVEDVRRRLDAVRLRLLEARRRREAPGTDTKIITAWNGLMILALADGAWCLGEPRYLHAARRAADFVLTRLRDSSGGLLHTCRAGRARFDGYLDDYAFMVLGLLKLHEASLEPRWAQAALDLAAMMFARFWDEAAGCFFYTPAPAAAGGPALVHRPRDVHDTSTPSALAAALAALIRLEPFAREPDRETWSRAVDRVLALYAVEAADNPFAYASLIMAADQRVRGAVEVTLAAPGAANEAARVRDWHDRLGRVPVPGLVVTMVPPGSGNAAPIWSGRSARRGRATAYVCRDFTCSEPLHEWEVIARHIPRPSYGTPAS